MIDTILCTKCGEQRNEGDFYKRPDGRLRRPCKSCHHQSRRQYQSKHRERSRQWRAAHREMRREYNRQWYEANAERERAHQRRWRAANREAVREQQRQYRVVHREARREYHGRWYKANAEAKREAVRQWHKAHPEQSREQGALRRARKKNAPFIERIGRAYVFQRDRGRCHICGKKVDPKDWHLDHLVSLSRSGDHSYRNVAVSHPECNLKKGADRIAAQLRLFG